jgi:peroxiredoxin
MVEIGEPAPDFELRDQRNAPVRLAAFRERKNVVVLFYPFTFTPVCASELAAIRDQRDAFQNDVVQLLAVSCDSVPAHRVWDDQEEFGFPLLADFWPHGAVAGARDPEEYRTVLARLS